MITYCPSEDDRVSPVFTALHRGLESVLDETRRRRLVPLIPLLAGTADDSLDEVRSYMALDWLVRTCVLTWLDLAGLTASVRDLRDLPPVDQANVSTAKHLLGRARTQAADRGRDVDDKVWKMIDAAQAATGYWAVDAAALAGARPVALRVTEDVISITEYAGAAAWRTHCQPPAAPGTRFETVLQPTVDRLQDSVVDLCGRMIQAGGGKDAP